MTMETLTHHPGAHSLLHRAALSSPHYRDVLGLEEPGAVFSSLAF